jgi:hypothetical protein
MAPVLTPVVAFPSRGRTPSAEPRLAASPVHSQLSGGAALGSSQNEKAPPLRAGRDQGGLGSPATLPRAAAAGKHGRRGPSVLELPSAADKVTAPRWP